MASIGTESKKGREQEGQRPVTLIGVNCEKESKSRR